MPDRSRGPAGGRAIAAVLLMLLLAGCVPAARRAPPSGLPAEGVIEARWGVRIEGLRLTADGYMIDSRYRVVDPGRALAVADARQAPVLSTPAGARLFVPSPPRIGSLRQTARNGTLHADRVYFVLFANPARYVQRGDRVSIAIGVFRVDDLPVE